VFAVAILYGSSVGELANTTIVHPLTLLFIPAAVAQVR
jgi:hypothetical protein